MKKTLVITLAMILIVIVTASLAVFFYIQKLKNTPSSSGSKADIALEQKDMATLAKPAIVRIVVHVSGKAQIPDYTYDIAKGDIAPNPGSPMEEIPFDEYFSGSGFIANEDGYIITNSHVVSFNTIKRIIAAKSLLEKAMQAIAVQSQGITIENQGIEQNESGLSGEQLAKKIFEYVSSQGKFDITKQIVVMNPKNLEGSEEEIMTKGLPAKVVSVNDDFSENDEDIALLKIEENNLPVLKMSDSVDGLSVGSKVFVGGYPSSADFNGKNLLEPTITGGAINALKDSQDKSFKVYQTDAKISQGSSGGPLLSDQGEVTGVVIFQTGATDAIAGDNFAFALPSYQISPWIAKYSIDTNFKNSLTGSSDFFSSQYAEHFKEGLRLLRNKRGKKSLNEFSQLTNGNSKFPTDQLIDSYIKEANQLISSGQSVDTAWDEKKIQLGSLWHSNILLLATTAGVILIILIILIFILFKRLKRDENQIKVFNKAIKYSSGNTISEKKDSKIPSVVSASNPEVYFSDKDQKKPK